MNHLKKITTRIIYTLGLISLLINVNPQSIFAVTTDGYMGSGKFPTSNLYRCHAGGNASEAQNAAAKWSYDTDINSYDYCGSVHIYSNNANYGYTGWAGYAYICSQNGQCDTQSAFDSTYTQCTLRLNQTAFSNNPGFYTSAEIQKLATHEYGHCISLWHSTSNGSVMNNGSVPNGQDISLVNTRY